ncbi:hypothetical protein DFH09DRAFT_1069204 [Mycena vulgaris]|nr:hypothetical protein DFH09DRAFT_1069204 [Mycena vulgaris]
MNGNRNSGKWVASGEWEEWGLDYPEVCRRRVATSSSPRLSSQWCFMRLSCGQRRTAVSTTTAGRGNEQVELTVAARLRLRVCHAPRSIALLHPSTLGSLGHQPSSLVLLGRRLPSAALPSAAAYPRDATSINKFPTFLAVIMISAFIYNCVFNAPQFTARSYTLAPSMAAYGTMYPAAATADDADIGTPVSCTRCRSTPPPRHIFPALVVPPTPAPPEITPKPAGSSIIASTHTHIIQIRLSVPRPLRLTNATSILSMYSHSSRKQLRIYISDIDMTAARSLRSNCHERASRSRVRAPIGIPFLPDPAFLPTSESRVRIPDSNPPPPPPPPLPPPRWNSGSEASSQTTPTPAQEPQTGRLRCPGPKSV